MDWKSIGQRLDPIGLILLVIGALLGFLAGPIANKLFNAEKAERAMIPIKVIGLALVVIGAFILMDFFG